jgi:hypothetical protein
LAGCKYEALVEWLAGELTSGLAGRKKEKYVLGRGNLLIQKAALG